MDSWQCMQARGARVSLGKADSNGKTAGFGQTGGGFAQRGQAKALFLTLLPRSLGQSALTIWKYFTHTSLVDFHLLFSCLARAIYLTDLSFFSPFY